MSSSHVAVPLRELRFRLALSQAEVAQLAGVSVVTVNSAECGRSLPRPRVRRAIAEALNTPTERIEWRVQPRMPAAPVHE